MTRLEESVETSRCHLVDVYSALLTVEGAFDESLRCLGMYQQKDWGLEALIHGLCSC